jgi:hypothetical protein
MNLTTEEREKFRREWQKRDVPKDEAWISISAIRQLKTCTSRSFLCPKKFLEKSRESLK